MTDTPEDFRVAARLLRRADFRETCGHYEAEAKWFERKADEIEQEQADEKRTDEYAKVYADAFAELSGEAEWCCAPDYWQNAHRAGVRALLDKLRIDSYTSTCDGKCGDNSPHNAHLTPEGRRHFLAAPRKWARIEDVPGDVSVVTNTYSDPLRRDPKTVYGWRFAWDSGGSVPRGSLAEHGPYTEVIADA
ncbi:hypothetical protein AAI421_14580 [Rhodococcus aetherivorans]|uniref:hypothetical protein n=1 Tax=Rhodococcus aetherivorans TaxID=191292 RepID=UPI0031D641F6